MSDRMFRVLVLGGMALVGCGSSTTAQSGQSSGGDASADAAAPLDASVGLLDGTGMLDVQPGLGDGWVPREGPPPPPPPPEDAQAQDAAGDADGYADAMPDRTETGVPSEAPPQ